MTVVTIGVDISKARLDVHRLSDDTPVQFGNDKAGFRAMRSWLEGHDIVQVVYEATGPYHRALETALGTRFPLIKVNPLQARRFAQARGTRAKTDAVDARLLAEMGRAFDLKPQTVSTERQRALKELLVARQALIKVTCPQSLNRNSRILCSPVLVNIKRTVSPLKSSGVSGAGQKCRAARLTQVTKNYKACTKFTTILILSTADDGYVLMPARPGIMKAYARLAETGARAHEKQVHYQEDR